MNSILMILVGCASLGIGALIAWLKGKSDAATTISGLQARLEIIQASAVEQKEQVIVLQGQLTLTKEQNATLSANHQAVVQRLSEQQKFVEQTQQNLKDAFGSLSADALKRNTESFAALSKPLSDSLTKMDEKINALETKREGAYSQVHTLLDQMKQSTIALDKETRSLVNALKTSTSRGRYGEIALRRLVEFAGMLEHCDFEEQVSTETDTGRLRPDMVIRLPESRRVVVDSKVPLAAYLEIFETEDTSLQKTLMDRHVAAIKTHLKQLGSKAYWDQFPDAPDFVVLFMQIESSFGAALQTWPGMIEEALSHRIIIATPTTLITILRSIGYSWSQLSTMENIEAIRDAAVELYERSATLMEHMANIGKGLTGTISHYNKAVGSLEAGFLPQGRKIHQLASGFTKKAIPDMPPVEVTARDIVAIPPVSTPPSQTLSE
ncbi:MAG TPA: DNA recombination protein RmuC [Puia sp.]